MKYAILAFFLITITVLNPSLNPVASTLNNSQLPFEINLSGVKLSFSVPSELAKDFPPPSSLSASFDLSDPQLFSESDYLSLYSLHWDFSSGLLFKTINCTLAMKVNLEKSKQEIDDADLLMAYLPEAFRQQYSDEEREQYEVYGPVNFTLSTLNGSTWVYYQFEIQGQEIHVYSLPVSKNHYLSVNFKVMGSTDSKNWREAVDLQIKNTMASFAKQ